LFILQYATKIDNMDDLSNIHHVKINYLIEFS